MLLSLLGLICLVSSTFFLSAIARERLAGSVTESEDEDGEPFEGEATREEEAEDTLFPGTAVELALCGLLFVFGENELITLVLLLRLYLDGVSTVAWFLAGTSEGVRGW